MKTKVVNLFELLISVGFLILLEMFFTKVVKMAGIKISLDNLLVFIKYLMAAIFVTIVYRSYIKIKRHRVKNTKVNNLLIVILSVVLLIVITMLINKLTIKLLDKSVMFPFMDYTNEKFNISLILKILTNSLLLPYIFVVIFVLGISNNIKNPYICALISGISFGICYGYSLNLNFEMSFYLSLMPAVVMLILSYLNKINKNIWNIIIIYILYVSFGAVLINYIM